MKLSRLFVYPVKSLAGIELTGSDVDEFGLAGDRRWLVVDEHGEFITQRDLPQLALIHPEIVDGGLQLRAPGMSGLQLEQPEACERTVRVWDDVVSAYDAGAPAAE